MSNTDDDWLFESVIGFLNSPMWNLPVKNFMESNCYVFNPLDVDDDSNDIPEYTVLHRQYKNIVDALLITFLNDIGVSQTDFSKACKQANRFTQHPAYMDLFEQLWAADNFRLFKSIMSRKNIELELQAVLLLQHQLGLISNVNFNEDEIMSIVIQRSKDEFEGRNRNISKYDLEIAKNIVTSKDTLKSLKNELEVQDNLKEKLVDLTINNSKPEVTIEERGYDEKQRKRDESKTVKSQVPPPIQRINSARGPLQPPSETAQSYLSTASEATETKPNSVFQLAQAIAAQNSGDSLNANELERRAEFMRKQREILLQKKQTERQLQLDSFVKETENTKNFRPMSSRAARAVLANPENANKLVDSSKEATKKSSIDDEKERKRLEARRALAEVLKKEVINNSKK